MLYDIGKNQSQIKITSIFPFKVFVNVAVYFVLIDKYFESGKFCNEF